MEIIEIKNPVSDEQVSQVSTLFADAFGRAPAENFLQRLNEKKELETELNNAQLKKEAFDVSLSVYQRPLQIGGLI